MDHLGPKMAHPHNSGSAISIVLQFCTMEGANRDMEIILMFFQKQNLIWGNLVILAKKWYNLITLDQLSVFLF